MTVYDLKDIEDRMRIPRGRLREWLNAGYVRASVEELHGSKTIKRYTTSDLYEIAFFLELVEGGRFLRSEAGIFVRQWHEAVRGKSPKLFNYIVFLRNGGKVKMHKFISQYGFEQPTGYPVESKTLVEVESLRIDAMRDLKGQDDWKLLYIVNMGRIMRDVDSKMSG
jgi:hypothetical protein